MIVRSFAVDESQMPDVGRRSREIIEDSFPEITWEHSHVVVDDSGKIIGRSAIDFGGLPLPASAGKPKG